MRTATTSLAGAISAVQAALGETQEGMARRIGCTLGAYSKWVRGERIPSGDWLLKIMALAPNQETLQAFGLRGGVKGPAARLHRPSPMSRHQLHTALDIILDSAPETVKERVAEMIQDAAGKYSPR